MTHMLMSEKMSNLCEIHGLVSKNLVGGFGGGFRGGFGEVLGKVLGRFWWFLGEVLVVFEGGFVEVLGEVLGRFWERFWGGFEGVEGRV